MLCVNFKFVKKMAKLSSERASVIILILFSFIFNAVVCQEELPSVYEYFQNGGIQSGLVANKKTFWLNGKEIRIISGGMHYFRIHPSLWRDRLRRLRAIGANSVDTYVSWNLHEPQKGQFDFGNGNNDFSEFMDIRKFIQIAAEEDLLVILRPGPYICAEWEWGGFPSWLARDPNMRVRENYQPFLDRVKIYFDNLLPLLHDLKFTNNGSIIAMQIENEYMLWYPRAMETLEMYHKMILDNDFGDTLLFTGDNMNWREMDGWLPASVIQTVTAHDATDGFNDLSELQPDAPYLVIEFYPGWNSHWGDENKKSEPNQTYFNNMEKIFDQFRGSLSFYMFHGGTNFGFMNGANADGQPPYTVYITTTYDFDGLVSEAGDYHEKYDPTARVISQYEIPKLRKPSKPEERIKAVYTDLIFKEYLSYADIIERIPLSHKVTLENASSMENLPINNNNGQSFGYLIYRISRTFNKTDKLKVSYPRDLAQLIIDGEQVPLGYEKEIPEYWINSVKEFDLNVSTDAIHTLDIMVENGGRVGFGISSDFKQEKGIAASHDAKIEINDVEVTGIEHIAAEFSNAWAKNLTGWRQTDDSGKLQSPVLLRTTFNITDEPVDTFLDVRGWHKGIIFVNGFNIGRYWKIGPQFTLFVPAPLLKVGENEVIVFEQLQTQSYISFRNTPILGDVL